MKDLRKIRKSQPVSAEREEMSVDRESREGTSFRVRNSRNNRSRFSTVVVHEEARSLAKSRQNSDLAAHGVRKVRPSIIVINQAPKAKIMPRRSLYYSK